MNHNDRNNPFVVPIVPKKNAYDVPAEANLDKVKTTIHKLLMSHPERCMTVNELHYRYKRDAGESWPVRQLNFRNNFEFLLSISDTVEESSFQNDLQGRHDENGFALIYSSPLQVLNYEDRNPYVVPVGTKEYARPVRAETNLDDVKTTIYKLLMSHPERCMTVNELYRQYKNIRAKNGRFGSYIL